MQPTTELPQTFLGQGRKDRHPLAMDRRSPVARIRVVCTGKTYQAHRLAYETAYGPSPDGLTIDHHAACRVASILNTSKPCHFCWRTTAEVPPRNGQLGSVGWALRSISATPVRISLKVWEWEAIVADSN